MQTLEHKYQSAIHEIAVMRDAAIARTERDFQFVKDNLIFADDENNRYDIRVAGVELVASYDYKTNSFTFQLS